MIKKFIFIVVAVLVSTAQIFAQPERRDKAVFIESKSEFWDSIQTTLGKFYKKDSTANKKLRVDFRHVLVFFHYVIFRIRNIPVEQSRDQAF